VVITQTELAKCSDDNLERLARALRINLNHAPVEARRSYALWRDWLIEAIAEHTDSQ